MLALIGFKNLNAFGHKAMLSATVIYVIPWHGNGVCMSFSFYLIYLGAGPLKVKMSIRWK